MHKIVIFFSFLNVWSISEEEGAPSFYNTIKGYINDGFLVFLIKPSCGDGITNNIEDLHVIKYNNYILWKLCKIKKISFFARILNSLYGNYKFYHIGKRIIKNNSNSNIILYAYEVNGVAAAKRLQKEFGHLFVSRFQGTVLYNVKNTIYNRLKWYPHFNALKTQADIVIMTDDGTFGFDTLKRLKNRSRNILILKNGVNKECLLENCKKNLEIKARYKVKDNEIILMTVSRLASWKRIDRAIIALSNLKNYYNISCKLMIIGDGDQRSKLEKLAKDLKIENDVIFIGAVKQNEVKYYLPIATIFLSLYDLSNVGNPLFEAMAAGKPIITIDNGDTSSIIKNYYNGILLQPNEIPNIHKYIIELINNKELMKNLGDNARKYIDKNMYTWDERIRFELEYIKKFMKD